MPDSRIITLGKVSENGCISQFYYSEGNITTDLCYIETIPPLLCIKLFDDYFTDGVHFGGEIILTSFMDFYFEKRECDPFKGDVLTSVQKE